MVGTPGNEFVIYKYIEDDEIEEAKIYVENGTLEIVNYGDEYSHKRNYHEVSVKGISKLKSLERLILSGFNYEKIYTRRDLFKKNSSEKTFVDSLRNKFKLIFTRCLKDLEEDNYDSPIFRDHIEYIDDKNYRSYFQLLKKNNKLTLIVRDYIAGMSDKYFSDIFDLFHSKSD